MFTFTQNDDLHSSLGRISADILIVEGLGDGSFDHKRGYFMSKACQSASRMGGRSSDLVSLSTQHIERLP